MVARLRGMCDNCIGNSLIRQTLGLSTARAVPQWRLTTRSAHAALCVAAGGQAPPRDRVARSLFHQARPGALDPTGHPLAKGDGRTAAALRQGARDALL
eukprot:74268-Pleurochrysis_carterae.AAC.2